MQPRVEKSNFRFCAIIQIYTEELGGESMRKPQICIKTAYLAKSILSRFAFLQKGGKQTDCLSPPCTLQREHCPPPPSWPALQSRPGVGGEPCWGAKDLLFQRLVVPLRRDFRWRRRGATGCDPETFSLAEPPGGTAGANATRGWWGFAAVVPERKRSAS